MRHAHVAIAVADAATPGVERVPARKVDKNTWILERSPLYATEVASGDTIRILDQATGGFEILERGGNVGVHFYLDESDSDNAAATARVASDVGKKLAAHRGTTEAYTPGLIAFTIPVSSGLEVIEAFFTDAVTRYPGAQWQYTNIFDQDTGEPLNWWE